MCRSMSTSSIAPYSLYFGGKKQIQFQTWWLWQSIFDKINPATVIILYSQQLLKYILIKTRKWREYITQNTLLTVKHKAFRIRREFTTNLDVMKQFPLFIQPAYKTFCFKVDVTSHLHSILNGLEGEKRKIRQYWFLSSSKYLSKRRRNANLLTKYQYLAIGYHPMACVARLT